MPAPTAVSKTLKQTQRSAGAIKKRRSNTLSKWTPRAFSVDDYQDCFMEDLVSAYVETRDMTTVEQKIAHWKTMPLTAEEFSTRTPSRGSRKTWVFLCLLMANTQLKPSFTKSELEAIDESRRIVVPADLLYFRKSNKGSNSWRPWSECAHLKKINDVYMLAWL